MAITPTTTSSSVIHRPRVRRAGGGAAACCAPPGSEARVGAAPVGAAPASLVEAVPSKDAAADPAVALRVQDAVADACADCGIEGHVMASGAYHDAMVLARTMPVGMLFVPSAGGISHHPDEHTDPADLDLGVDVLTGALRRLAER